MALDTKDTVWEISHLVLNDEPKVLFFRNGSDLPFQQTGSAFRCPFSDQMNETGREIKYTSIGRGWGFIANGFENSTDGRVNAV